MAPPVEVKTNLEASARAAASSAFTVPADVEAGVEARVCHGAPHVDLGCEVEDAVGRNASIGVKDRLGVCDVELDGGRPGLERLGEVLALAAREVVEHEHLVAAAPPEHRPGASR